MAWLILFKLSGFYFFIQFDIGYNDTGRNTYFRIEITNKLVFENTLTRSDFYIYPDTINAPFIGPTTKGEANQAIRKLEDTHVLGIIRGIIEHYPDYYEKLTELFSTSIVEHALIHSTKLIDSNENITGNDIEELASTIDESES